MPSPAEGGFIGRGTAWTQYPDRRQFDGVAFEPGGPPVLARNIFNTWHGWGVEPKEGACPLYLAHLRDIICNGVEADFKRLLVWAADAIQNPGRLPGIAIALRGGQGTGKGQFVLNLGALFGVHFAHVVQPEQIVGKFNAPAKSTRPEV